MKDVFKVQSLVQETHNDLKQLIEELSKVSILTERDLTKIRRIGTLEDILKKSKANLDFARTALFGDLPSEVIMMMRKTKKALRIYNDETEEHWVLKLPDLGEVKEPLDGITPFIVSIED